MSFQLSTAFTDGIRRTTTRTGGIVLGLYLVFQTVNIVLTNTAFAAMLPAEATGEMGLTLPLPGAVAGVLLLVSYLVLAMLFVVIARAFARPLTELSTFPSELYTRRIGRATASMIVASILVFVAVAFGTLFFLIPGVFFALCFLLFWYAIAVEDRGPIDGLRRSWDLSRGNRLKLLFVLGVLIALSVASAVIGIVSELVGIPAVGDVIAILVGSAVGVVYQGILAATYLQLVDTDSDQL